MKNYLILYPAFSMIFLTFFIYIKNKASVRRLFEPEAFHFTMPHFLPPNIIWAIIEFQLRHLLVVESEYKTHPFPGVHNSGFDGHLQ